MKKINQLDIIVIGSSILTGVISIVPTLYFNISLLLPLSIMLLTTIIAQQYIKFKYKTYKIQIQFNYTNNQHQLTIFLIGIYDDNSSIVKISVKNFNAILDIQKVKDLFNSPIAEIDEDGYLSVTGCNTCHMTYNSYVEGYNALLFYKAKIINICHQFVIANNVQPQKRKSILFWR